MLRNVLASISAVVLLAGGSPSASAAPLSVIELFQSEGCSSCPPAEANLNRLAARPDILALSFEVTYWDYLGWKDRYGSPAFTQRQRDYAAGMRHDGVYTPQMVINGRKAIVGVSSDEITSTLRQSQIEANAPVITASRGAVTVAGGPASRDANVVLITYDPRTINTPIHSGENSGRTLPHRNIVLSIQTLGHWHGGTVHCVVAPARAQTAQAILVQQGTGGQLIAAAKL